MHEISEVRGFRRRLDDQNNPGNHVDGVLAGRG